MPPSNPSRGAAALLFLALLARGGPAAAEPDAGADRRVLGSDPSEIVSRLEVRNEYHGEPGGGYADATIFRGDWAPSDWLLGRVEVPVVAVGGGESGRDAGLGDILVGVRGKVPLGERWSLVAEMAAFLDTASSEELGAGMNVVAPLGVAVWKPSPAWILALQYQWFGSVGGGDGREPIRESSIRPQALRHLPHGFWVLLDPRIYVNHADGAAVSFFPELEIGDVVARHVEIWCRGGGNAAGDGRDERLGWIVEAGVRYLFD